MLEFGLSFGMHCMELDIKLELAVLGVDLGFDFSIWVRILGED